MFTSESDSIISEATLTVRLALDASRRMIPNYFYSTLMQRISALGGAGFVYPQFTTVQELETELQKATWEETKHPTIIAGCRVFKTHLPGHLGVVSVQNQPGNTIFYADDIKKTGFISLAVKGILGDIVPETYLITGKEDGETVVYTVHPGEPIRTGVIKSLDIPHGAKLSKEQALELGFKLAKIIA